MAVTKTWSNPETATGSGGLDIATGATITETYLDRIASCLDFRGGSAGTPGALAANSGAQSISNNTLTALTLGAEFWDSESMHSTSTNTSRVLAPWAGIWLVGCNVIWAANATGQRQVYLRANGATFLAAHIVPSNSGSFATTQCLVIPASLAASDYVECLVLQDSGGSLNASVGTTTTGDNVLWMVKV